MTEKPLGGANRSGLPTADHHGLEGLIDELQLLHASMLESEARLLARQHELGAAGIASARNLAHLLALRSFDLQRVQQRLTGWGVACPGRAEAQVLTHLEAILGILHLLAGRPCARPRSAQSAAPPEALLAHRAAVLFGDTCNPPRCRVMVTLPSAAAFDEVLVNSLVRGGMDVARIDCAQDSAFEWAAMATAVRRAALANGRSVKVLMELAGPRLRTGAVATGPAVLKLKPERDAFGAVVAPVRLGLRVAGTPVLVPGATAQVGVDAAWLAALEVADQIDLVDARASSRRLTVLARRDDWVLVEGLRTVYLTPETRLRLHRRDHDVKETELADLPAPPGRLLLRRGEMLRLAHHGLGHDASDGSAGKRVAVATIACTLPDALGPLRKGERVWFDQGRIGAVVRRIASKWVELEVTDAADEGSRLGADKRINLPDTRLELPALTAKDIEDLAVVVRHADLVGLSFAQGASDVKLLRRHLRRLQAEQLGIIVKVQTRRGFEHLPQLLVAALACPAAGLMIAPGELGLECGFERLAEVQQEALSACNAAHLPLVLSTQGLGSEGRTGLPSRAEISDAALGVRADCVMLNRGPHTLACLHALEALLRRMGSSRPHGAGWREQKARREVDNPGAAQAATGRRAASGALPARTGAHGWTTGAAVTVV